MMSPGAKLGTYELTGHIGSDGMGDVYRAHDSKLGRNVAIKVLPEQFAREPERLRRQGTLLHGRCFPGENDFSEGESRRNDV
jgi:serine/threonine protein kinase